MEVVPALGVVPALEVAPVVEVAPAFVVVPVVGVVPVPAVLAWVDPAAFVEVVLAAERLSWQRPKIIKSIWTS